MRFIRVQHHLIGAAFLACAGCAQIATVKVTSPRPALVGQEPNLAAEEGFVREARKLERRDATGALGHYLAAAHGALDRLKQQPGDRQARAFYNFCVARSINTIENAGLTPWEHPLEIPAPNSEYTLTTRKKVDPNRNPADYELIPADNLVIGGTALERRVVIDGIGAPLVAAGRKTRKDFRERFTTRRLYANTTAIIRFTGNNAEIEFCQPFETKQVQLAGHTYPLAADYTAAIAVGLTRERPYKLGLIRMLRPEKYAETAQLARLQIYDPNRIPVVFVHGLQDTPVCWVPMINALYEDPDIRRRYQFWVYSYPSGYAYPYSASLFRQELDGVTRAFPNHKKIVLIGHSMGGMISRLMVTDVGDKIWRDYFGTSPADTKLPEDSQKLLEQSLIFNHHPSVSRAIFVCAPHRGSGMASNWIGRIGTNLIRMPFFLASIPFQAINAAMTATTTSEAKPLKRFPSSIDTLSPTNRFVVAINKYPVNSGIPYHSIIGDRGRGDTPDSSDGVVAYWSSHLEGAQSELIVPANHSGALSDPKAIAEVQRILHQHH